MLLLRLKRATDQSPRQMDRPELVKATKFCHNDRKGGVGNQKYLEKVEEPAEPSAAFHHISSHLPFISFPHAEHRSSTFPAARLYLCKYWYPWWAAQRLQWTKNFWQLIFSCWFSNLIYSSALEQKIKRFFYFLAPFTFSYFNRSFSSNFSKSSMVFSMGKLFRVSILCAPIEAAFTPLFS